MSLLPYLPKIISLVLVAMPRHEQGILRHVLKSLFLLCHGMLRHEWAIPRHASLGFLYGVCQSCSCCGMDQSCRGMLLNFAQNCSFMLSFARSLIILLDHHLHHDHVHIYIYVIKHNHFVAYSLKSLKCMIKKNMYIYQYPEKLASKS